MTRLLIWAVGLGFPVAVITDAAYATLGTGAGRVVALVLLALAALVASVMQVGDGQ